MFGFILKYSKRACYNDLFTMIFITAVSIIVKGLSTGKCVKKIWHYARILFRHKEECNHIQHWKMDTFGDHHIK